MRVYLKKLGSAICLLWIFIVYHLAAQSPLKFTSEMYTRVELEYGIEAVQRIQEWEQLLADLQGEDDREKLFQINRFFNRIPFIDDAIHWKKDDYWATPIEFLATNGGDCEDFSIAKYLSLRALGVSNEKMRMMYVKALTLNQSHMVLAYFAKPTDIPLVLDNINKRILPASKRTDLQPIYSFNGDGLWVAKAQGRGKKLKDSPGNKMWGDLNQRLERDF